MARIQINDLDVNFELDDKDLETVVAGANSGNVPNVEVSNLLPKNVFPAIGSSRLGV